MKTQLLLTVLLLLSGCGDVEHLTQPDSINYFNYTSTERSLQSEQYNDGSNNAEHELGY